MERYCLLQTGKGQNAPPDSSAEATRTANGTAARRSTPSTKGDVRLEKIFFIAFIIFIDPNYNRNDLLKGRRIY